MAETTAPALEIGFTPAIDAPAPLTLSHLDAALRSIQRLVFQTAAHSLGRDELTATQQRDYQLVVLDAHHSDLWVVLGVAARTAVESLARTVVERALHPLLERLKRLLAQPEAQQPIDAATLRGLVHLTQIAAASGMDIQLQAASMRFTAARSDYPRLSQVQIGYLGDLVELRGVVSELSLKRNELTLDLAGQNLSVACRFSPAQALAVRDVVLVGRPLIVQGRGVWGGAQISAHQPDYILVEALLDGQGRPLLAPLPPIVVE